MKTPRQQIYEMVAEALDVPAGEIRPEAPWEEYGGDSLAVAEMVLTVQDHFRITLQTEDLDELKRVDDLVRVVERKLSEDSGRSTNRAR